MVTTGPVGVVVLAGGASRRFGADKLAADLGGRTVLARTVDGVRDALPGAPVVVVGPAGRADGLPDDVLVVSEDPPGSGPAAGVLAGARRLAAQPAPPVVVVVAPGDSPWAGGALAALVAALDADPALDTAVAVTPDGRRQHLLLAVRADLLAALDPAALVDAPARALLAGATAAREVPVGGRAALDVDDPAALARARALLDDDAPG